MRSRGGSGPLRVMVVVGAVVALVAAAIVAAPIASGAAEGSLSPVSSAADPVRVAGPRALGPADADAPVPVRLGLRGRDPAGLERFLADLVDPTSSDYQRFLTPAEYGRRFGLDEVAEARLVARLEAAGLSVVMRLPQRTALLVEGPAGVLGAFLGVGIEQLEDGRSGHRYLAADRPPLVPADLRDVVTGVTGLERVLPFSAIDVADAPPLPSRGLKPRDIALAYGLDDLHEAGFRGEGTHVAIVQMGPDTDEDLAVFDATFDLDGPTPERIPVLTGLWEIGTENGKAPPGFAQEATLDTQVVRATAPEAQILVFGIPANIGVFGLDAVLADGRAQVASYSYGTCDVSGEFVTDDQRELWGELSRVAMAQGVTLFVASGDFGAYTCHAWDQADDRVTVAWPACTDGVVSVGGTYLEVEEDGSYRRETGWQDYLTTSGTGGGLSPTDARPSWQVGAGVDNEKSNGRRQCPDVAAAADSDTGYHVFFTDPLTGEAGWHLIGGTSASAPLWAGTMALVQQAAAAEGIERLGFLGPLLYRVAADRPDAFHDVVRGGNLLDQAGPGWDYATGLGSPNAPVLAEAVIEALR